MPTSPRYHHAPTRRAPDVRPSAHARGYGARWQHARLHYLALYPTCAECERQGYPTPATVVDHVIPHKGDYELFWDQTNWQALCVWCHNAKSAKEKRPPPMQRVGGQNP